MEPEELRKLRIAHGLTRAELAQLLHVSPQEVFGWEAPKGSSHHAEIEPESRRRILRQLASFRVRQKERHLIATACASARRFSAQPFVPALAERELASVA
jgi:transcriptional regulator with XRE-family HTH domain